MSTLYNIKAIKIDNEKAYADFNIKVVHPDAMTIHETAGFGLHVINNVNWKASPISNEISNEDLGDANWCSKYAHGFIKKVEIVETLFEQPEGSKYPHDREYNHPFWQSPHEWPEAILRISATDPAWLEHIKEGDEWDSAAYNPSRYYDACKPIKCSHGDMPQETKANESSGWIPFPSFLINQGTFHLPKALSFPAYTESAYELEEVIDIKWDDPEQVMKFQGQYVHVLDEDQSGFLVWNDVLNVSVLSSFGRSSSGTRQLSYYGTLGKVARWRLKDKYPRKIKWMGPWDILKHSKPVLEEVEADKKKITLHLSGVYDIDELALDKARVLKMICNNYVETFDYETELECEFPLSKVLKFFADIKENISYPSQVIPLIADGIILDYKVEYPDRMFPDFDELSETELIEFYENWPCFKIHILLSDEIFGLQLTEAIKMKSRIVLTFMNGSIKKIDKPLLWRDFRSLV